MHRLLENYQKYAINWAQGIHGFYHNYETVTKKAFFEILMVFINCKQGHI